MYQKKGTQKKKQNIEEYRRHIEKGKRNNVHRGRGVNIIKEVSIK